MNLQDLIKKLTSKLPKPKGAQKVEYDDSAYAEYDSQYIEAQDDNQSKEQKLYNQSFDFETSVQYLAEQSNKRAWFVAIMAVILAILSLLAVLALTPLKSVEPYVIRVDNVTGAIDIVSVLNEEQINSNEALDKHFVAQYVKRREGYNYDLLNQDYTFVQLLSSPEVAEKYRSLYKGDNARDSVYKNNVRIEVDILSVVLNNSNDVKTATIRINLRGKNRNSKDENTQFRIITLSYEYQVGKVSEEYRLQNPLGFKVLSYRIDEDIRRN